MPARIYRGPADRQPKTISNRTVSGALLPGTAVLVGVNQLTQATNATSGRIALLSHRDWMGVSATAFDNTDPLLTPYLSGDTGEAYVLETGQAYQWAMAAGTYTHGQALTVGASGRLTAAGASPVVAYYDGGASVAHLAGDLAPVVIA